MTSQLYDQVQDIEQRVEQLEITPVSFAEDPNTTDNIWQNLLDTKILVGTVTMSSGSGTVVDPRITDTSKGFISYGDNPPNFQVGIICNNGTASILAAGPINDPINYFIIII